ncbi:MAG: methyltransferase, partial [Nocardioides sp.]|nr:methyltransferase [Nocardioides sp.]
MRSSPVAERGPGLVERLRAAGCVHAEEEAALLSEAASGVELERLVARRAAGEPLEHVVGWALFDGHRVAVRPGVFVPRRRTEPMITEAADSVREPTLVVDLCCGSGALGLALARRLAGAGFEVKLHAADLMDEAVECARENLGDLGEVHL